MGQESSCDKVGMGKESSCDRVCTGQESSYDWVGMGQESSNDRVGKGQESSYDLVGKGQESSPYDRAGTGGRIHPMIRLAQGRNHPMIGLARDHKKHHVWTGSISWKKIPEGKKISLDRFFTGLKTSQYHA